MMSLIMAMTIPGKSAVIMAFDKKGGFRAALSFRVAFYQYQASFSPSFQIRDVACVHSSAVIDRLSRG